MKLAARSTDECSPRLLSLARSAALSPAHWARFFTALREIISVDRICALVQLERRGR